MTEQQDDLNKLFTRLRQEEFYICDSDFTRDVLQRIEVADTRQHIRLLNIVLISLSLILIVIVFPWQQALELVPTSFIITPLHLIASAACGLLLSYFVLRCVETLP